MINIIAFPDQYSGLERSGRKRPGAGGEQGRGFAVVAGEYGGTASRRSAGAAKK